MKIREHMEKAGVIRIGHFLLTSKRHSDKYVHKDSIYCDSDLFPAVLAELNNVLCNNVKKCDVITGPAVAGSILALPLSLINHKIFVYPEKIDGGMVFRRGYDKVISGKNVVLIEDIITTGGSVIKTIDSIRECGGTVTAVLCIWNRTKFKIDDIPLFSLIDEEVESWEEKDCKLCKRGVELIDPKG